MKFFAIRRHNWMTHFWAGAVSLFRTIAFTGAAAVLIASQPAQAQDENSSDDTEQVALLSYLGLTAADGSLSVGENSGSVEGQIIASILVREAAEHIVDALRERHANRPAYSPFTQNERILLLTGDETFSTAPYRRLERQISLISSQVQLFEISASLAGCSGSPLVGAISPFSELAGEGTAAVDPEDSSFEFRASDIFGLLRTSSSLQNVPVTVGNQMLRNALINQNNRPIWILPSEISDIPPQNDFEAALEAHRATLMQYAGNRCVGTQVSAEDLTKIRQQAIALVGIINALYQSKDGAPSAVDQAAQAAAYMRPDSNGALVAPRVLRVNLESAGGTVVTSENILTSLFVPGVTIRGGLVISYRMIDPSVGTSEIGGILVCRFPLRVLRSLTSEPMTELRARAEQILGNQSLCDDGSALVADPPARTTS